MKKTFFILILSLNCCFAFCQTTIEAIVSKKYSISIIDSLYNGRKVLEEIYDNSTEDFFVCVIERIVDDYALIRGQYTFDSSETIHGWILLEALVTYPSSFDTLCFYERPDYKANRITIDSPTWIPLKIKDINNDWVFVLYSENNLKCQGWVNKKMLCANPYTICN